MNRILTINKALSDRNRLRTVMALENFNELCACQITELLGISGATASRHLALLVGAGLLESRKEGRWVFYRLSDAFTGGPVLKWLKEELWNSEEAAADREAVAVILAQPPEALCRKQRGETCRPGD